MRTMGAPNTAGRLKFVDGLRGVAAMMVVVYHLAPNSPVAWLTIHGGLGVHVFFVLSGFVIASVIGDERITAGYFGRFVLRRFVRLDIPYWLNIALAVFLGAVVVYFGVPERHYGLAQIAASVFYLQGILGFGQINDVYWTLCFEIQFYLSLLLLVWLTQRARLDVGSRMLHLFVLATIAASVACSTTLFPNPRGAMFIDWWGFGLGALTWWTITGRAQRRIFALAVLIAICFPFARHADQRLVGTLTAVSLFAAAQSGNMGRWLADPVMQFLGRISYSLYLFHPLTGGMAQKFAERYLGKGLSFVIGVGVSILCAWIVYRLIERPAIALSRRIILSPVSSIRPSAESQPVPLPDNATDAVGALTAPVREERPGP